MVSMFKKKKVRNRGHRMFVASLPCVSCMIIGRTQAAHIRSGNSAGMSLKSADDCVVPLCCSGISHEGCHELQGEGEISFWMDMGGIRKATALAKELYNHTGDRTKAMQLMLEFRK